MDRLDPASNALRQTFNVFAVLIKESEKVLGDAEKTAALYEEAARQIRAIVVDVAPSSRMVRKTGLISLVFLAQKEH